jgi:hypothetical protein
MSWGSDDAGDAAARTPCVDDETVDALVDGADVPADVAHLAAFAGGVRAVGRRPSPRPSPALATLLAGRTPPTPVACTAAQRPGRRRSPAPPPKRRRSVLARIAGAGLALKIGLGASSAAAGVLGAGALHVLPGPPGQAARAVIGTLTPLDLGEADTGPGSDEPDHRRREDQDPRADGDRHGGGRAARSLGRPPGGAAGDHRAAAPFGAGPSDRDPGADDRPVAHVAPGDEARPPDAEAPVAPVGSPDAAGGAGVGAPPVGEP